MSTRAQAVKQYNNLYDKLQNLMNTYDKEISEHPPEAKEFAKFNKKVLSPQIKELARKLPKESEFFKTEQSNLLKLAKSISEFQAPIAGIINVIERDEAKGLGKQREELKKGLSHIVKEAAKAETVLIQNSDSEDASRQVSEYYDAVIESQEVSKLMSLVAGYIVQIQENKERDSLKDKIIGIFDIITEKIKKIADKVGDTFRSLGNKIKDALDKIKQDVQEGAKKIADIFRKFAQKLSDLTAKIIEKIFGFVSWMNTIAKTKGFGIKEISLKLPSASVEVKNLIVLAVPVVEIQTPEVTFTFKPDEEQAATSKKKSN